MCAAGNTTFTFKKEEAKLPIVSVVGGSSQTFLLALGKTVQTSIDLSSVCPGEPCVLQAWADQMVPAAMLAGRQPQQQQPTHAWATFDQHPCLPQARG